MMMVGGRTDGPAEGESGGGFETYPTEVVLISELRLHPRNYREHPPDQIAHIKTSLQENGQYRNIITAQDLTILGGHGVYLAALELGWTHLEVKRMPLDPHSVRALKILAADNEIGHLAEIDDRALTHILKQVMEEDETGLDGTGFDERMLAALVYVSRPEDEVRDFNAAAHWVGMPEYDEPDEPYKLVVNFADEETRREFAERMGVGLMQMSHRTCSTWWPPREKEDRASLLFDDEPEVGE